MLAFWSASGQPNPANERGRIVRFRESDVAGDGSQPPSNQSESPVAMK